MLEKVVEFQWTNAIQNRYLNDETKFFFFLLYHPIPPKTTHIHLTMFMILIILFDDKKIILLTIASMDELKSFFSEKQNLQK